MSRPFWYLATPYTKFPAGVEQAFIQACVQSGVLIRAGIRVFSPIAHSHAVAMHGGVDPHAWELWMDQDGAIMDTAHGLIMCELAGWRDSVGMDAELKAFIKAGKPVVFMTPGVVPVEFQRIAEERVQVALATHGDPGALTLFDYYVAAWGNPAEARETAITDWLSA